MAHEIENILLNLELIKKAKGLKKNVITNRITFKYYVNC